MKSLVVLSFCMAVVMGTQYHSRLNMRFPPKAGVSTHFGYSLPSGYASTSYHFRPVSIDAINKFALSKVAQKNKKVFIKPLLSVGRNFFKNEHANRKYHKYYNHRPFVTPTYTKPAIVPSIYLNTIGQYPRQPVPPHRPLPPKQFTSNPTTPSLPEINSNKIMDKAPKSAVQVLNPTTRSPPKINLNKIMDNVPENSVQPFVNSIPDAGEKKETEDKTVAPMVGNVADNNVLMEAAEEGLSLLSELIENLKQEAQTSANSDPEEVTAVKGVFFDVIDEIIKQIETNFKTNSSNSSDIDSLLSFSKRIRNEISEALTQTRLVEILEPFAQAISNVFIQEMQSNNKQ